MGKVKQLKEITRHVLSYCDIPQEISENNVSLSEGSCDSYIEYEVTPKKEQENFDDDFDLDNWIIKKYPYLEGKKLFIHLDY